MKIVLFTIGEFNVYSFGFFLALAFLLSTFIIWKYAKEEFKEEEYLDAYLFTSITALIVARGVYILRHLSDFGFNILKYILVVETPGLSLASGFIGGYIFLWWYCARRKIDFFHILDIFSLGACVLLIFSKIGQILGGATYGRETNSAISVSIAGLAGRRHPVELYEAFLFLILSILLFILYGFAKRHKYPRGILFYVFGISINMIFFVSEFLKLQNIFFFGISTRQILAIIGIIILSIPLAKQLRIIYKLNRQN